MAMTLSRKQNKTTQAEQASPDLETLFHEQWERLCGVLFRMLGDEAEAEDLALEAFVKLYRRPPSKNHNLAGWLYRVATNLGLNALRARQRRQRYEEEAGSMMLEDGSPENPATAVERMQERQQVRNILSAMKPRSAQLLMLRHSGLSYAEIATSLDVSPTSVGKLLARAEQEFEQMYSKPEGRRR
jgi:RNA polymerase sigma-70 factor (ECF subfamily)